MKINRTMALTLLVAAMASESLLAGNFRLQEAVKDRDVAEVKRLVEEEKVDVNMKDDYGRSALRYASWTDQLQVVRLLVACGADVSMQDDFGCTPLYEASKWGFLEVAKFLLSHGADVNIKDNDGHTPLSRAVYMDHPRVVRLLILCDADILIQDKYGKTALDIALEHGHSQEIREFMETITMFAQATKFYTDRNSAITTIFTGKNQSLEYQKLAIEILINTGDAKRLKKVFEMGLKVPGLLLGVFGKEIMYEDVYKKELCSKILDNPHVTKNFIINNYYDETMIYDHYSDKQRMYENPKLCLEMINALKKQRMLNVFVAQSKNAGLFFNFK